jgi:tetratricopeptide (TPR) repeat protein
MYKNIRILFSLAVFSAVSLWSADSVTPVAYKTQAYEQNFNSAVELFNKSDFEGAYKKFSELFEANPGDPRINFYLGRSALETKRYEDALSAFERVLIVEPTHIRSRIEMARAYFELKEFDSANMEFDKALEADIPKKVKEQILAYKKAIDAAKQKHFINGYLMAGIGWDSNVNNGIGTKDYSILNGLITLPGEQPRSDYYHTEVLGLNHIWNLSDVKEGLFWQDSFTAYLQSFRQSITNNARYFGLTTGPVYRTKEYEASVAIGADKLVYGSAFPYMQTLSISPKVSYKLSDTLIAEGSLTLKNKFYLYENGDRNSLYEEAYAGVRKLIPSTGSMVTAGITVSKEMKKMQTRTDISNSAQKYALSVYHPIVAGLDLTAGVAATKTAFVDTDVSFSKIESDFSINYNVGLIKTLNKSSMLNLTTTYADNKSNIENKVYTKKGVSLSYIYNF